MRTLKGSCLCGKATFEVDDAFEYALICHCSKCRRATGSAFKPVAGIAADKLKMISPDAETMRYGDKSAFDLHCKNCGSLLYSSVRDHAYAHVPMGTLVDTPTIRPSSHIFTASKAQWHEITDDLPQHEGSPQ